MVGIVCVVDVHPKKTIIKVRRKFVQHNAILEFLPVLEILALACRSHVSDKVLGRNRPQLDLSCLDAHRVKVIAPVVDVYVTIGEARAEKTQFNLFEGLLTEL